MKEAGRQVSAGLPLKIVTLPDPRLHQRSSDVTDIDDDVRRHLDNMVATIAGHGVGLAGVQVGIMKRILIIDCKFFIDNDPVSKKCAPADTDLLRMINPIITAKSDEQCEFEEGCLSVPGIFLKIKRSKEVTAEYEDYWGNRICLTLAGRLADCLQHELDHLNGVVITDRVSGLKRHLALKKLYKIQKHQ